MNNLLADVSVSQIPRAGSVTLPIDPTGVGTIGVLLNRILPYVYVIAGLALLYMLVSGGITLMTAAGNPGKTKEGYGKLQAGLVGFVIIFIAYFVTQIVEVVLGVKIF